MSKTLSLSGALSSAPINLSYILQCLVLCMIFSIRHPKTKEWMNDLMEPMVDILETILLRDKKLRKTLDSRELALDSILKDMKIHVEKHFKAGKRFGLVFFFKFGIDLSYRLEPAFDEFFKILVNEVLRNPPPPKKESSAPKPAITKEFPYEIKIVMKTLEEIVWIFSPKERTIPNILEGILDESNFKVLYGRGYTFCRLCVRTMEDVNLVIENLNGKLIKVPKPVRLSVELIEKQKESDNRKPAPEAAPASEGAPASESTRFLRVEIINNGSNISERMHLHEASFLKFAISTKTDKFPDNIKICHQDCKQNCLLLKIDSVQNAELAMQKMNGQEYFYCENHRESLHTVKVTFTTKF